VHSSYFEMLGEHGFIGLFLYMILLAYCLWTCLSLKGRIVREPAMKWATHFPDMLQVSVLAYMLGGAFLGRAYFDFFYHLVASVVILKSLALQQAKAPSAVAETLQKNHYIHPAARILYPARR